MTKNYKRKLSKEDSAKIKAMETKKKEETAAMVVEKPTDELISFDQWWVKLQRIKPLPAWEREIIWADMKARGLKRTATHEAYNKALALYGYKLD